MNSWFKKIRELTTARYNVFKDIESTAYTWFGRPNVLTVGDKFWVGGVKNGIGQVTEYDTISDSKNTYIIGHIYEEDDHNQVSMVKRASDDRIIFTYTGHNSPYLSIAISTNPLDASSLASRVDIEEPGVLYSYPSPYQASNGDIFVFFRSNVPGTVYRTSWNYIKSTDGGVTWSQSVILWQNPTSARTMYLISSQDGDLIHFIGTPGNPEQLIANQGVLLPYHFTFNLLTEIASTTSGSSISLPVTPSNATLIFSNIGDIENSWIQDVIVVNGLPRVLFIRYGNADLSDDKRFKARFIHYSEWDGANWITRELYLEQYGYIGKEFNTSVVSRSYSGNPRFSTQNPDIIICPRVPFGVTNPFSGRLELFKHDLRDNSWEQLTFDSKHDNWRPITTETSKLNVLWLYNKKYITFLDFNINLRGKTVDLS